MKLLRRAIAEGSFLLDVRAEDLESLFRQTVNHLVAQGLLSTDNRDEADVVLPLLRNAPMAVLYGLFLFMGIVSMSGNQFFERLNLWFMDSARYPSTHYLRKVPRLTIHLFSDDRKITSSITIAASITAVA